MGDVWDYDEDWEIYADPNEFEDYDESGYESDYTTKDDEEEADEEIQEIIEDDDEFKDAEENSSSSMKESL